MRSSVRHRCIRSILACVVGVVLVPVVAAPALATLRASGWRSLISGELNRGISTLSASTTRAAADSRILDILPGAREGSVVVMPLRVQDGGRYRRVVMLAESSDKGARLAFFTGRDDTERGITYGFQAYEWSAPLPASDIHFGPHLRSISIHTGSDLGSYGAVDLQMASASGRKSHTFVCRKTGKRLGTFSRARARMKGTVELHPQTPVLPATILTTSVRSQAISVTRTDHRCPHRHGHGHYCPPLKKLDASDGAGSSVYASALGDGLEVDSDRRVPPFDILSVAYSFNGRSMIHHHHGTLRVDPPKRQHLIQGSLTFVRGDWGSATSGRCGVRRDGYDGYGGTLVAAFDAGALTLHGSGLSGALTLRRGSSLPPSSPPHP